VLQISLGTVKSRLIRGRNALKERLEPFVLELGREVGKPKPVRNVAIAPGSLDQPEVEAQS
jgi:hypothetical protein